ncbi:hypothetical protein [Hydrogenophaga sp. BPS33]|uniref:hypothetical protein n=1 Tax=Hydrogenophaga sp. BPS33 TaxID=2651974 RepID=UPI00131FA2A2|nr:hypothetical protein [Hydrogenophaga sp. BPS33]QHE86021.1 hypothetical protein F9K07_14465 [Hydrogenophaga sp. BPS33]
MRPQRTSSAHLGAERQRLAANLTDFPTSVTLSKVHRSIRWLDQRSLRWQARNVKYILASEKYMGARFAEDEAAGGVARRKATMDELTALVRRSGEAAVNAWLDHPDKLQACRFAIAIIESGAYDISPKLPMYDEHESLVQWAQQ